MGEGAIEIRLLLIIEVSRDGEKENRVLSLVEKKKKKMRKFMRLRVRNREIVRGGISDREGLNSNLSFCCRKILISQGL